MASRGGVTRAGSLLELGRTAEAIPMLESAVIADPEDVRARCLLAQALLTADRNREALSAAEGAIALAPELDWPHRLRALALLANRRPKQAVKSARHAASLEPGMPQVHMVLAMTERAVHRLAAARKAAEHAVELDPESSHAHDLLGRVALEQKARVRAESAFRKALELDPENAQAMNNLGVVLKRTGRGDQALALLEGAVRLDPRQDVSRENTTSTARDILTGGGWLIPIVVFLAVYAITALERSGVEPGVAIGVIVAIGAAIIALYERMQMRRLSPTARALLLDERRHARARPWNWRPQYVYLPWPVIVGRMIPAPIWLVVTLGSLVLVVANYGSVGSVAPVIVGGFAILAALSGWRTQRWMLRRGWL